MMCWSVAIWWIPVLVWRLWHQWVGASSFLFLTGNNRGPHVCWNIDERLSRSWLLGKVVCVPAWIIHVMSDTLFGCHDEMGSFFGMCCCYGSTVGGERSEVTRCTHMTGREHMYKSPSFVMAGWVASLVCIADDHRLSGCCMESWTVIVLSWLCMYRGVHSHLLGECKWNLWTLNT